MDTIVVDARISNPRTTIDDNTVAQHAGQILDLSTLSLDSEQYLALKCKTLSKDTLLGLCNIWIEILQQNRCAKAALPLRQTIEFGQNLTDGEPTRKFIFGGMATAIDSLGRDILYPRVGSTLRNELVHKLLSSVSSTDSHH